jgi:hypothetical protein
MPYDDGAPRAPELLSPHRPRFGAVAGRCSFDAHRLRGRRLPLGYGTRRFHPWLARWRLALFHRRAFHTLRAGLLDAGGLHASVHRCALNTLLGLCRRRPVRHSVIIVPGAVRLLTDLIWLHGSGLGTLYRRLGRLLALYTGLLSLAPLGRRAVCYLGIAVLRRCLATVRLTDSVTVDRRGHFTALIYDRLLCSSEPARALCILRTAICD